MVNESTSGIELVNWLCHMLLINITLFLFYLIYCFLLNPELNEEKEQLNLISIGFFVGFELLS
jgi:uncharacterized membrane protein